MLDNAVVRLSYEGLTVVDRRRKEVSLCGFAGTVLTGGPLALAGSLGCFLEFSQSKNVRVVLVLGSLDNFNKTLADERLVYVLWAVEDDSALAFSFACLGRKSKLDV